MRHYFTIDNSPIFYKVYLPDLVEILKKAWYCSINVTTTKCQV